MNPQMNRYQNPFSSQINVPVIPGKMVMNENAITPQDIPMDGNVSLFPQADWKCIWAKWWNSNGMICTCKFVPEETNAITEKAEENLTIQDLKKQLDKIERMIEKPLYNGCCDYDRVSVVNTGTEDVIISANPPLVVRRTC